MLALREKFVFGDLEERGRLQFFYHSLSSPLPVRDVLDEQGHGAKTEPHIEKRAENYCVKCYQQNIVGFLKSREKFLFLFTKCKTQDPDMAKFKERRFIVGYIVKERALFRGTHWAVQGTTRLYSFEDAYPLSTITKHARNIRVKKLKRGQTAKVLDYFYGKTNILDKGLRELRRLKRDNSGAARRCR